MKDVIWRVGLAAVVIGVLASACGGGEETAPGLSAPPTRTPLPTVEATQMAVPGADLDVAIISLRGEIDAFLTAAESTSPIDRPVLFEEHVINAVPECVDATYYPNVQPLELFDFNLVSLDLTRWAQAVESLPDDAMSETIRAALVEADALLPVTRRLTVCILPLPAFDPPEEQVSGDVEAEVLAGDLLVVACSGGDDCLSRLPDQVLYAYGYAYQVAQSGLTIIDMPLLNFMIYSARAEDFVHRVYPATTFPWADALTPAQEATLWADMQDFLATTYSDYPDSRKIERFLYGRNNDQYPNWGGLYVGSQIVRAYRAAHPDVAPVELMALPPETLLDESGYAPE